MTVTRQRRPSPCAFDRPRSIGDRRQLCYRCRYEVEQRMNADLAIGVAGAGSIGCFVGGMLATAGRSVALLARPRVIGEIQAGGLRLTSFEGFDQTIASSRLALSDDPSILSEVAAVLVTVKSADTSDLADLIARQAPPNVVGASLQNGAGNVAALRRRTPDRPHLSGTPPS